MIMSKLRFQMTPGARKNYCIMTTYLDYGATFKVLMPTRGPERMTSNSTLLYALLCNDFSNACTDLFGWDSINAISFLYATLVFHKCIRNSSISDFDTYKQISFFFSI
uniref:Uncharacterized protein n=1 Tax=Kalanchoe fedtschenkoi TaxID=63787 RepID=A0A7N0UXJ7_KALFE